MGSDATALFCIVFLLHLPCRITLLGLTSARTFLHACYFSVWHCLEPRRYAMEYVVRLFLDLLR